MDWNQWYLKYDSIPSLQARLKIVCAQVAAALHECPAGPLQLVSLCAGDGRDVIGALTNHPRRDDVVGALLDNHPESLARGRAAAERAGLGRQLRFIEADATLAASYAGLVPADLVLLSGFLSHLRTDAVPDFVASLPMFCKTGGWAIWSRHLVMNKGRSEVPATRELLRDRGFQEVQFETTSPDGFAVSRARFTGETMALDTKRGPFEFVGLDRLLPLEDLDRVPSTTVATSLPGTGLAATPSGEPSDAASHPYPMDQTIPGRFAEMVQLHPARPALASEAWRPTYAELDALTNRMAHVIISNGGTVGGRVAILMRQDAPLVAATLAVVKAGRVVVVLNPTEPAPRLRQILDDAEPDIIVADAANRALAGQMALSTQTVIGFEECTTGPADNPDVAIAPTDLAWLIYTSGSTGRPKGVMQTHCNIVQNVRRFSRGLGLRAEDRLTLLASPSGGQGVSTIWCALLNGAALCPFPIRETGLPGLGAWMNEHQITNLIATASVFRHFTKTLGSRARFPSVRAVRLASEPATAADYACFQRHFAADCLLLNTLSSTETGNIAQHPITRGDRVVEGRLPVGRAVEGMEILLVDEQGREVRNGEPGEIVVRSHYLSPGYWRDDALTAERFSGGNGPDDIREFRSGDLGRRTADGTLVFVDRNDARVKIHGNRVEPSEVEAALLGQPNVEGALVSARTGANGDHQLIAHLVMRGGRTVPPESLRRTLRATLPAHMVPSAFVFLDEFPLTPHGKIDRQALPAPPPAETTMRRGRVLKPRDVVERNLVKIWESVLGMSPVGRADDFFELGGTSLQAVEVLVAIEEIFDVALPASALVEHSTVERLAPLLSDHAVIPSLRPLVVLRESPRGRPLFFIHSGQGDVVTYGLLVRRLAERPIYGLQAMGVQGESWPLMSVPAMAERYMPEILEKDPTGPYLLAGTCMGGMVAYEIAQQLVKLGKSVSLLALLDAPTAPYSGVRPIWHEATIDPLRDAIRIFRWGALRAMAIRVDGRRLPAYRRFVAGMTGLANRRYRPKAYPGKLTLMLTRETKFSAGDRRRLIGELAHETQTILLPGSRPGLFVRPGVDELARQFQKCLDAADRGADGAAISSNSESRPA